MIPGNSDKTFKWVDSIIPECNKTELYGIFIFYFMVHVTYIAYDSKWLQISLQNTGKSGHKCAISQILEHLKYFR